MSDTSAITRPKERIFDVDFYDMPGISDDFHQPWKELQDGSTRFKVIWTPRNGGHWIATRASSIQEIITDYTRFSSYTMIIPPGEDRSERWEGLPICLDPPEHQAYRRLLNAGLSPRLVKERADQISSLATSLIDNIARGTSCDFAAEYAEQFPVRMLFIIMDLPYEERGRMLRAIEALSSPDGSMTFAEINREFADFLRPFIQARVVRPGTDLISHICTGRIGDRPITEHEATMMTMQTFAAGLLSVRNALSFIMLRLAEDIELQSSLRADPSLIPKAIEESHRRYSAMVMTRQVIDDVEFDGVVLRKGELIACPVHLVGLDEKSNDCPMNFDMNRTNRTSVPFGAGPHFCPGKWLADFELELSVREWLARIPEFHLVPGENIRYNHGMHGGVKRVPLRWSGHDY